MHQKLSKGAYFSLRTEVGAFFFTHLIIVGAGPAGLSAAIEAAEKGLEVVFFDENAKPGGQLFKQIHKFFGLKEHKAKIRGFKIGEDLLKEADKAGVKVVLNATVCGMCHVWKFHQQCF